ncbi:MAG: NADH-quinone oxidoreductase subunit L [Elusimicrobiota bacterium]|jgi:NADH:ubiquinone oxidoreductase subunit 5 (subunit L)/multisubunit Na+/H+ antiporter MnhA subunit|nr:NADH-quinone oxidoreductase subunit L [Elusimicrobiota bacterium]
MFDINGIISVSVLFPLIGGILVIIASRLGGDSGKTALCSAALTFILSLLALHYTSRGYTGGFVLYMPMGMDLRLVGDLMGAYMACASSFLSFIIMYYSQGYITEGPYKTEFYAIAMLFLGAMTGLVYSVNLIWLFVFWEITAICSWRLVGYFRAPADILKANKTFIITVFGALFLLLAAVAIADDTGTLDLTRLRGTGISVAAATFIILAAFSKSAIFPFSCWLPDAGVAPSPVTALLHAAVLVKIGVFAFARIFYYIPLDPDMAQLVMYVAGISSLIAGASALKENNIKRIIAYSTISQLGFIFLGIAAGGFMGMGGALLFILMHGAAKGGLFLCAGIIEHKTHTKDITQMGGLAKTLPITAFAFAFCALSVMGIPPFGGFFSKFMVFAGAARTAPWPVIAIFAAAAALTLAYLSRVFYIIFIASGPKEYKKDKHEAPHQMLISVVVLAAVSLLLGVFSYVPLGYIAKIFGGAL